MIRSLNEWKLNKINENMRNQYVKDGIYYVGQYGLGCDPDKTEMKKAATDEESEHIWSIDIPEGSTVKIEKDEVLEGDFGGQAIKITVLELGNEDSVPFDMECAEEGETYYSTEDSTFGSMNIKFIK